MDATSQHGHKWKNAKPGHTCTVSFCRERAVVRCVCGEQRCLAWWISNPHRCACESAAQPQGGNKGGRTP